LFPLQAQKFSMRLKTFLQLSCLALQASLAAMQVDQTVAILGESRGDGDWETGFLNEKIADKVFDLIRSKHPQAVFFTGNSVLGLVKNTNDVNAIPAPASDSYNNQWRQEGFKYTDKEFKRQLERFLTLRNRSLGDQVPFYPVIGVNESLGPHAAAIFRETFGKKNEVSTEASQLAYTVVIGHALFVVFSSASFDAAHQTAVGHDLNPALLAWLEQTLRQNRKKYPYLFVVSNLPAFSTDATGGIYRGFDEDEVSRSAFWRILWQNGVLAYFCSGEHLYDRSNRYGIWQIISGGAGAPLYKKGPDRAFAHFLLVRIPSDGTAPPRVQVFDTEGRLVDEFDIISREYPIFQLRIS